MSHNGLPKATITFSGQGQAGNWSDAANWAGGAVPNTTSSIGLLTMNAHLDSSFGVYRMMMLGNEQVTINGTLSTMSTNRCNSFMVCDNAVANFTSTSALHDAGGLVVGKDAVGTVNVQGNGANRPVVASRDGKIGQHLNSHGIMTIDDAAWHVSERMFVGLSGIGTLSVSGASQVTVGDCFGIGANKGGTGSVTLSGGSTLSVGTFAIIGGNGMDTDTPPPAGTGVGTGTLTVDAGSAFSAAQFLKISTGSAAHLAGGALTVTNAFPGLTLNGGTLSGFGTVSVGPAGQQHSAGIIDNGAISASGGVLVLNSAISGTGQVHIAAGSTLAINGASIGVPSIAFDGGGATLSLAHGIADHATIAGFAAGDTITMAGIDGMGFNASTDVLSLTSGGHVVDTLQLSGSYDSHAFTFTQDSMGGGVIGLASAHTSIIGH